MTLNSYFTLNSVFAQVHLEFLRGFFENNCVKIIKVDTYRDFLHRACTKQKCSAWTLVSGDIRFMQIFARVLKCLCTFSLDLHMPVSMPSGDFPNYRSTQFRCAPLLIKKALRIYRELITTTTTTRTTRVAFYYPRDAMLARVFATATCLSVRLSHAGIVPSRAKAGS